MSNIPASTTEFLQDVIRKTCNPEIREWFRDVTNDDDITTPRGALLKACTHQELDSMPETVARMLLFYQICNQGEKLWLAPEKELIPLEGNPQVILHFVETTKSWKARKVSRRHTMRCSFRIMNERFESASDQAKVDRIAANIKREFPPTYRHQCGQTNYVYEDKINGYQLRIAAFNEQDARQLVSKLLDCSLISGLTLQEKNFSKASTKKKSPVETRRVLGKTQKVGDKRPSAVVYLKQADLFIPGYGNETLLARGSV